MSSETVSDQNNSQHPASIQLPPPIGTDLIILMKKTFKVKLNSIQTHFGPKKRSESFNFIKKAADCLIHAQRNVTSKRIKLNKLPRLTVLRSFEPNFK